MRKIFTLLVAVLLTTSVFAQAPEKMSYQAVIRNTGGTLVTSTQIGMEINIRQGSETGTVVYTETQTPTSNANGLVSIEIGTGTTSDDFTTIDWANGSYFLKTEIDPAGGTNYTITGTSELMSVPYALQATTAENGISSVQASAITANTAKAGITTMQADEIAVNTLKPGITAAQADEIAVNTLKTGITTAQATKLAGIEEGAEVNVQADWNQTITTADDYIKNKPTIPGEVDGSETKITAGANITVTGFGTIDSPYVVNATRDAPLTIGQSYQGGKIFWLDDTGQHGLIAATADLPSEARWYIYNNLTINAARDGIGSGIYNTERIIANQGSVGFAAQNCANFKGGTYSDWYLPSKYELNLLYLQRAAVGGFASTVYWSSTEYGDTQAWAQSFGNGYQDGSNKDAMRSVRAVRTF